jgi:hypothetical protein
MDYEEAIIILRDTARNGNTTVFKACMIGIEAIQKVAEMEKERDETCQK